MSDVPLLECNEPLQAVSGKKIFVCSAYYEAGYPSALPDVYLRRGASEHLQAAAQQLPDGLALLLWDGWRSLDLQNELYQKYSAEIAKKKGLRGSALHRATRKFVSPPDRNAPHATGGTVDLSLCNDSGEPLDMGGEFDQLHPCSRTDFYPSGSVFAERRSLLRRTMQAAGFSNYPEEWWHFDAGNRWHHGRVGGNARYGFIELS